MVDGFSTTFLATALVIAVVHAALGPDHYLPFVALARARDWSRARLLTVTTVCGVAHVLSSVVLGAAVILVGESLGLLEAIEAGRGTLASWALIAFGLAYAVWGALRPHHHDHGDPRDATFWTLFAVFVLGPCEPLVPLVFLPAAEGRWALAGATALVFGVATIATMVAIAGALHAGARRLRWHALEHRPHLAAGAVLALSGALMLAGL